MRIGMFSVVDGYADEDGRSTQEFYEQLLLLVEAAEAAGLDSFWIAEHHFHQYGVIPRAALWLAAAAQRTKQIKLGAAVVVLPFDNPVRTAEDFAMVDMLSGGRLRLGVGSGYLKHEFDGFGITLEEKRERFDEALEILMTSWRGEKFSFAGKYNQIDNVALNVLPVQRPAPPVAIAILNAGAAEHVGTKGFDLMLIPYATTDDLSELTNIAAAHKRGGQARKHVDTVSGDRVYFALHTCLTANGKGQEARELARPYMDRYVRTRLYAKQRSFEELLQKNLIAAGDESEVMRLLNLYEQCGLTDFLAITNFGGMPHERVLDTISHLGHIASLQSGVPTSAAN